MNLFENIDQGILVLINGLHHPFLDEIMWILSTKWFWIPLYMYIFFLGTKIFDRKRLVYFVLFILTAVILSDLVSVQLFKNIFQRYRPSHNTLLQHRLHYYLQNDGTYYRGGLYGFVSSHAANFLAVVTGSWFVLKNNFPKLLLTLIPCAFLVCVSRIYLGVHYPSDIFGGVCVGMCLAFVLHRFVFLKLLTQ